MGVAPAPERNAVVLSTEAASYDYVIVGGGSAGCVVASRLAAASPDATVALIRPARTGAASPRSSIRRPGRSCQAPPWTGATPIRGPSRWPAADRDPARQGPRRLQRDQRDAVVPGPPGRLRRLGGGRRGRLELRGDAALPAAQRGLGGRRVRPARRGRADADDPAAGAAPDRGRHDRRRGRLGLPRLDDANAGENCGVALANLNIAEGRRFSAVDGYLPAWRRRPRRARFRSAPGPSRPSRPPTSPC